MKIQVKILAVFAVLGLSVASQAQLFIEDFDTFTAWSGGAKTQIASKNGDATNGWVKATFHNLRRPSAAISATGINGTQGAIRRSLAEDVGGAARDITGEINSNGNYMVRALSHLDPEGPAHGSRPVALQVGDDTMFERFVNQNELYFESRMIATGRNVINQSGRFRGVNGQARPYQFPDCTRNPDNTLNPGVPEGDPPCLAHGSGDYQWVFDFIPFGDWWESLINVNMNNGIATAWFRDVDDVTGEATGEWDKLPANFPQGYGSTVFGLPFTELSAAGFQLSGTSGGIIDNFISGHPLLANQGDFDGDGDIDGNDFLVWQNNFPTTDGAAISFIGDATGDGNVDGDDFLTWQNSFPYPATLAKTPEPASLGLLALGALLMLRRHAI